MQTSYRDVFRQRRQAPPDSVVAVLRALGVEAARPEEASRALADGLRARWERPLEPVTVAWDGVVSDVPLRIPATAADERVRATVELGDVAFEPEWTWDERAATATVAATVGPPRDKAEIDGRAYVEVPLSLPAPLPPGYHRLHVTAGSRSASTMLIAAPTRCWDDGRRRWGVFVPLYALRTARDRGAGDLTDLQALQDWTGQLGGDVVATLPLLAAFLDEPFEPSPYSPASRLFWNEMYLDVERVARDAHREPARSLLSSPRLREELTTLRRKRRVDYRGVAAANRRVLEQLAASFFDSSDGRAREGFDAFVLSSPNAEDYARFRAALERTGRPWHEWPPLQRRGKLGRADADLDAVRYHLFVQSQMAEQMSAVARRGRDVGAALHLDLPLGVNPDGYDTWRFRDAFALTTRAGAPPDTFFTKGQDWGFPPMHPERIREDGYGYPLACIRALLRHAGVLRIDHVMGLHRLFWIAEGSEPADGVYVRYHAEELYALLSLESHRARSLVVGEDLGTVPDYVRTAMRRHGVLGTYVVALEADPKKDPPLPRPKPRSLAATQTHDMAPFAAFWAGDDIAERVERGLLDERAAEQERARLERLKRKLVAFLRAQRRLPRTGEVGPADVLRACLVWLAAGPSRIVLASLEDLWLEREPQNRPGTTGRRNWTLRTKLTLEQARRSEDVIAVLQAIASARGG